MKKINVSIWLIAVLLVAPLAVGGKVHAQVTAPPLYNQDGVVVSVYDNNTNSLIPGWYYTDAGSPRYYYANGVYYDPATQTYGGSVLYPGAAGPESVKTFTPSVPNTGMGGIVAYAWLALILSAATAVVGTMYLTRDMP